MPEYSNLSASERLVSVEVKQAGVLQELDKLQIALKESKHETAERIDLVNNTLIAVIHEHKQANEAMLKEVKAMLDALDDRAKHYTSAIGGAIFTISCIWAVIVSIASWFDLSILHILGKK